MKKLLNEIKRYSGGRGGHGELFLITPTRDNLDLVLVKTSYNVLKVHYINGKNVGRVLVQKLLSNASRCNWPPVFALSLENTSRKSLVVKWLNLVLHSYKKLRHRVFTTTNRRGIVIERHINSRTTPTNIPAKLASAPLLDGVFALPPFAWRPLLRFT